MSEPDGGKKNKRKQQGAKGGDEGGGGGGEGGDKANKKAKYFQGPGRGGSGQAVPLGSRGILVTCDAGREDRAGHEAATLIEEHYDKLAAAAPPGAAAAAKPSVEPAAEPAAEPVAAAADAAAAPAPAPAADAAAAAAGGGGGGAKDIAALLAEEVAEIKSQSGARFRIHHTGVKGCIFVLFPSETPGAPGPPEVAASIAAEAQDRKQVRGRHVVRFLPVTATCFAGLEEIKAAAPKLLAPHFPEGDDAAPVEFAVEYEHRSADGFNRLDVINAFTGAIKTPPHKVNLTSPSSTVILVQLIRNACAMAVVRRYRELSKFNVRKLAELDVE